MEIQTLKTLLKFAYEQGASDLHFQVTSPPILRKNGELVPIKYSPLTDEDLLNIALFLTDRDDPEEFRRSVKDYDGIYVLSGICRFRVNIFRQRGHYAAALRIIPLQALDFNTLHLPPVLERIANLRRGLVLVTGATGNGKSTTIAAIIRHINTHRRCHVITIEDPIEFVFDNQHAIISQREVGADTESFGVALRAALRQDPDVIFVGELRDLETVDICLKAAETGHLVLSTIHTPDAMTTLGRLIAYFPSSEQMGVRQRIADNLMAIISLRLLMRKDQKGLLPAVEVMLVTHTIQECIKVPEKTSEIPEHIARNKDFGMQTFNQHLVELVRKGLVSMDVAKLASSKPEELERDLTLE